MALASTARTNQHVLKLYNKTLRDHMHASNINLLVVVKVGVVQ